MVNNNIIQTWINHAGIIRSKTVAPFTLEINSWVFRNKFCFLLVFFFRKTKKERRNGASDSKKTKCEKNIEEREKERRKYNIKSRRKKKLAKIVYASISILAWKKMCKQVFAYKNVFSDHREFHTRGNSSKKWENEKSWITNLKYWK